MSSDISLVRKLLDSDIQRSLKTLRGNAWEITQKDEEFPQVLRDIQNPPEKLFCVGDPAALQEGIAIVGARKSTPYGRGCAKRFARIAAEKGIVVISGGAYGCDAAAHRAVLDAGGITVAFLGGGCDKLYPADHEPLFQEIVCKGGAVVSEWEWNAPPLPYRFRARNRLIAGLARATLIVEAGLPSGTFSTADEALSANRDVLVVPGAITAKTSQGANRLLSQGAIPIVDDESFEGVLFSLFGALRNVQDSPQEEAAFKHDFLIAALQAEAMDLEAIHTLALQVEGDNLSPQLLMERLVKGELLGYFARHSDGKWGPVVK